MLFQITQTMYQHGITDWKICISIIFITCSYAYLFTNMTHKFISPQKIMTKKCNNTESSTLVWCWLPVHWTPVNSKHMSWRIFLRENWWNINVITAYLRYNYLHRRGILSTAQENKSGAWCLLKTLMPWLRLFHFLSMIQETKWCLRSHLAQPEFLKG